MRSYSRAERVAGLIQQTLSEILNRNVKDPRLAFTTITHVKVTRDLRIARVYFSTAGGEEAKVQAALQGFRSASGFVKGALAKRLELRYMPELEFFYDESFDYGSRIDQLLKSIRSST
ncbi:MAG TPA: 30S ribosome-binding factor RbfA [Desulfobacterales bacterium]